MPRHLFWAAPLAALLALGAAGPAAAKRDNCFHARNVSGFRAMDDKTVYLRVGVRDIYRLEVMGRCPEIDWSQRLALVSRGSPWICSGLDADLVAPSPIGPQHCPVHTLRKLTPREAAALPRKLRP